MVRGMDFTSFLLMVFSVYGQVVAVMNPFTAVNNFLTLTEGMPGLERAGVLRKAMIVVLVLGFIFIFAGRAILEFYHLSLNALRFGGGVLLMYIAIDMLSGSPKTRTVDPSEVAGVPVATPMIIGPGTMTLLINLAATVDLPVVVVAFLLSSATIAVSLRAATWMQRVLGRNGVKAMARFMALIIAAVAAEMLHTAVVSWTTEFLQSRP